MVTYRACSNGECDPESAIQEYWYTAFEGTLPFFMGFCGTPTGNAVKWSGEITNYNSRWAWGCPPPEQNEPILISVFFSGGQQYPSPLGAKWSVQRGTVTIAESPDPTLSCSGASWEEYSTPQQGAWGDCDDPGPDSCSGAGGICWRVDTWPGEREEDTSGIRVTITVIGASDPVDCWRLAELVDSCGLTDPADILDALVFSEANCGPEWDCQSLRECLEYTLGRALDPDDYDDQQLLDQIDEAVGPCEDEGTEVTNPPNPPEPFGEAGTPVDAPESIPPLSEECEGSIDGNGDRPRNKSDEPVYLFAGHKVESTTDLVVPLPGADFRVIRYYASNPEFAGAGLIGEGWTLSVFEYTVWEESGPVQVIEVPWTGPFRCPPVGPGPHYIPLAFPLAIDRTTITIDAVEYDVWRRVEPARLTRYYIDSPADPRNGLVLMEEDWYGNKIFYEYTNFGAEDDIPRLATIYLGGTPAEDDEVAQIRFVWDLDHPMGRLLNMHCVRRVEGAWQEAERVSYVYQADGVYDHLGSPGDLIQVIHRRRVEQVEEGARPWHERIAQYRYHREGVTPGTGDERLEVEGGNHQLKMVINPEQIEYIAQKRNEESGGTLYPVISMALREAAADLLAAEDDDEVFSPSVGDPLDLIDLAAKIIGYQTEGDGRILTQFLQTGGCGCSGGSAQGLKQSYEYFTHGNNDEIRTVRIEETLFDEDAYDLACRTIYYDLEGRQAEDSSGPYTAPYLVSKAIVEPGENGRKWVWHYEYESDRTLEFMMTPSAMASYTPANSQYAASYAAHTDEGLVYAFTHDNRRREETRLGEGKHSSAVGDYTLISKTTYNATREWLPDSIERFRVAGSTDADDVEKTIFEYGFFSSTDRVAWTRVKTEAELVGENGPGISGGYYESYELYDDSGLNLVSRAADHSLVTREYGASSGSVTKVTRNADPEDLDDILAASGTYHGLTYSGWTDRFVDGGSVETRYEYDLLGRQTKRTAPGGIDTYTVRESRTIDARPYLLYYAEVSLPHKEGSDFNGDATVDWFSAGGEVIGTSSYGVDSTGFDPPDYALTDELGRSRTTHLLSGLVEKREDWHDLDQDPYVTAFTYDEAGRLRTTTDPVGTITENSLYDVLNRVLQVQVGQSSQSMVTVAEYFYDFDHDGTPGSPEQGLGNGNLTYVREHVDGSTVRDTLRDFDFRDRPDTTRNPNPPHETVVYDNLDRVIERSVFDALPAGNRGLFVKTHYSQRGLVYRQSIATDPTSGSPEFLQTNSWFDPNGRTVVQWSPNSPIIKREFDGLGRTKASYVVRDATLYSYGPGRNGTPPIDDDGSLSPSLPYDIVLEQTEYEHSADDRLEFVTALRRVHDDASTAGPLTYNGGGGTALGVPSYVGHYYDAFNRRIRTVNIGSNDTTDDRFSSGNAVPTWPPNEVPEWDDVDFEDYLVSATEYDERGRPFLTVDPEGKETRIFFDAMHRRIAVVENYVNAAVSGWSSQDQRWTITGGGGSSGETDEDRVTSFVYDGAGNVVKQIAHIPGGDLQETHYLYEAAPANLLSEVRYPNESTGVAGTDPEYKVLYVYNRLGEITSVEDQNDTLHEYIRDDLGRVTFDDVTLATESPIDNWVLSIGVEYDDFGRLEKVTSYTTVEHTTVKNQAEFAYTPLWQIKEVYQDHDGAVAYDGSGVPTGNTVRVRYAYSTADFDSGNYSRLSTMTYPGGAEYDHYYGSASLDLDDHISRLTRFHIGDTAGFTTVAYRHLGLGMVAEVDYPAPDIQLDRTVSDDGKRRMQGFTSQSAGVYPGWDRFGRVKKHAWVDGGYTTGSGGNPDRPPLVEIDYTYDRSSNRLTRTDARPGASWADRDFRYSYDGLDRLVQSDRGAEGGSWSAAVGGQKWSLDALGNWDSIWNDSDGDGNYTSSSPDEEQERTHNFANEIEDIGIIPFAYDAAGNMTEQGLPATATKYYTHDAWNRLTEVKIDAAVLGEYEYNALHWRTVKRARSPGAGSLDEMRLMYYSANWQLLEERIDRQWSGSGFSEDERAQTFWGKRYIDDAVGRRRDRDVNGTWDDSFFYVTDAQFSTVAMAKPNGGIVERITYDSYGKARHHFGADVTGDGATTSADGAAIQNAYGNSIGDAGYKAELDLDRDGDIDSDDYNAGIALSGGVTQSALAGGMVSFVSTGSGGSTRHGPDNPIAWDGYVFNPETGQYHVRFRWYDPMLGRWLERDPAGYAPGTNLLEYVPSSPPHSIDPYGLSPDPTLNTCSGINRTYDYVAQALSDLDALHLNSVFSQLGTIQTEYSGDNLIHGATPVNKARTMLDAEAASIASRYKSGALCGLGRTVRIRLIMLAPKTHTRPLKQCDSCCNTRIDVVWSVDDNVVNQQPGTGGFSEEFWSEWGTVHTISTRDWAGENDPSTIGGGLAYLVGADTGPCPNHRLEAFLTSQPYVEWKTWMDISYSRVVKRSGWVRTGEQFIGGRQMIEDAMSSAVDEVWVCHSQGCNIAMHILNQRCRKK